MKLFTFRNFRTKLTTLFLAITLIPLLVVLIVTYVQRANNLEIRTFDKLTAIRELKVEQLELWLNERVADMKTASTDNEFTDLKTIIHKTSFDENDKKTLDNMRRILNRYLTNYSSYNEMFILNPNNGKIIVSSRKYVEGEYRGDNVFFLNPMRTRELSIKDIHFSENINEFSLVYSIPIYSNEKENEQIVGILVARIEMQNSLYKMLNNRVGLGKTGEALIVNHDVQALNKLRWMDNKPLEYVIEADPAVYAANGRTGIATTTDYRGLDVLASYTYIPQTKWGFVVKQDLSELNAPIREMMWNSIFIFIIIAIVISLIARLFSLSISKPIIEMDNASKKMSQGDFSYKIKINSKDELGSLSKSINNLAEVTKSRIDIQDGIYTISETMIGQSSLKEFGDNLLKQLMNITKANMSAFYILNEATMEYEHFASIGANEKLLSPFSAENPEGEIGNAISEKKIYYLRDIPENTIFNYKTIAGEASPKEIITIPILVENTVVAIISLVNIYPFNKECYNILEQSWSGINVSYSNLMANERTRIFAEQLANTNQQLEAQTEELQEQSEELQNQTEELQRSSEELQEQNMELDAQRKEVESANSLKSEFLSNMSHELRTPLNSIMALSRVLIMQANEKLSDEENNYLEIVERNGKRLLSLINDILDLSKIESGKMEISPSFTSISHLVQTVKDNLHQLADEKGLTLTLNMPDDLPQIETEEAKLHQVLINIVGNAVKFTEKGGVEISVANTTENLKIEIKDSGIGISKRELPHIFDEFRQADGSNSRPYEGTGLGLAIANKMITLLGGNIKVSSQLGEGTVFTIMIPIKWHEDILITDNYAFENVSTLSIDKTILVVDDDLKAIKGISDSLHEAGYKTISAQSGKEALILAEKYRPFAITLDIVMPEMDGWEVLQKLKNNAKTKDIPVIIISMTDEKDTGAALGAIGFVSKPLDQELLMMEIDKINITPETIMIVDDNDFERKQMSEIIESENINTILASGGKECIQLLKTRIPDILVLDLMMPDMDGFKVLEKIRKNPETQNLPVIVVTAKDITKEDNARLSENVSKVIAKSDTGPKDLYKEIKRILIKLEESKGIDLSSNENSKNRILIVEDNPEAVIQVKSVLEKENYIVDVASGGQIALDYIKHTIPDGIILDLMMPEMDGFEVLEKLRSTKKTKNTPVLILTAKDLTKKDLSKLSANNIQQLIHKGDIDIEGLILKVKLMLRQEPKVPSSKFQVPSLKDKEENLLRSKTSMQKPETSKQKPKVLIVEDNPDNMITVKAILRNKYNIEEAIDGEQGLMMAQSQLPDLILLDMALPKMSGEEIIKILKKNKETKHIPVIAVTAQAMKGDEERFLNIGCDGYVSKPIDQELLLAEISGLLGS